MAIHTELEYERLCGPKLDGRTKAFSQKKYENHSQEKKQHDDFREINHMTTRLKIVQGKCEKPFDF